MRLPTHFCGETVIIALLVTLFSLHVGGTFLLHNVRENKSSLSLPNGSFAPVVIPAVPHVHWSWDRIPTSYHGAPRTRYFNQSEIKRLAKYQMVTLEKWYTPCAAQGGYGIPQAPPSCDSEGKAEAVFQQLKRLSPNITTNLYWNSMFDFAFYEAHQGMLDLEARGQHAFLRDKHGQVVYLCNDGNAYCNVTTFDWTKPTVRQLWVQTVLNATAKGVDGIFADHSAQEHINIGQHSKGQHALQLCNGGSKKSNLGHSCWNFTADFAASFNSWHLWATNYTQDVLSKTTGGPVICGPLAKMVGHVNPCNFTSVRKAHNRRPPGRVFELHFSDPNSCRPSESCLAAYLAATEPGLYLHCMYNGPPRDGPPGPFEFLGNTSFPEMDYYLGAPNGSATEIFPGSNVWRRFFGDPAAPTVVEWDEGRQLGQIKWAHQQPSSPPPPPPPPSYDRARPVPSPLAALLHEIDSELQLLQTAIHDAEDRGVTQTYLARASLEVGSYFRNVSAADASNESMTQLLGHYRFFYADAPAGFADERARSLPLREANDTLALLQRARAELNASPRRPPLHSRDVRNATVCEGYVCNSAGQPVIPSGFNVWSFPRNTAPFDEAIAGIDIVTTGLGVDRLLPNNTLEPDFVTQILSELDAALAKNISVHTLGFGSVPKWAEQKWPGIIRGNFTQHGVNFDISSPGVPILMTAGIKAIFDTGIGCHPALGGFILGNEVTFMQSATMATVRSYRSWLQKRYDDTISLLNAAWDTTFTSFDEIAGQPAKPSGPLVPASAEWWDWNSFNNWRVTAMYSLMASEIHKNAKADPRCRTRASVPMTTLKLQDGNEFNGLRQKGINRSALVDALTWNGCDSGIASNTGLNSKGRINLRSRVMNPPHNLYNPPGGRWGGEGWPLLYNKSRYAADWLGQGAGYTLQHSLAPEKPLYDTEWHSIGTLTWRDEHMSPEYVELSVWFAVYHHLAVCCCCFVTMSMRSLPYLHSFISTTTVLTPVIH